MCQGCIGDDQFVEATTGSMKEGEKKRIKEEKNKRRREGGSIESFYSSYLLLFSYSPATNVPSFPCSRSRFAGPLPGRPQPGRQSARVRRVSAAAAGRLRRADRLRPLPGLRRAPQSRGARRAVGPHGRQLA